MRRVYGIVLLAGAMVELEGETAGGIVGQRHGGREVGRQQIVGNLATAAACQTVFVLDRTVHDLHIRLGPLLIVLGDRDLAETCPVGRI